jgi:PRC-barrel domain
MSVIRPAITLLGLMLSGQVVAQGVPQNVEIAHTNVQTLPAGFRASKLIGSTVLDDANENIGKVDDLLVAQGGPAFAILSVGGFLGMDSHYIAVPYDNLVFNDNKIVLHGATKNSIRMMPEFKYAK